MGINKIEPERLQTLKNAGYSRIISYEKAHPTYGWVFSYFPTVEDAAKLHSECLVKNPSIRNLQVEVI